jgi:uncharacterized membrane protein
MSMPFSDVPDRNIRTLIEVRKSQEKKEGAQDRAADATARFSGNMPFVYLHILWIDAWIVINLGWMSLQLLGRASARRPPTLRLSATL